VGVLQDRYGLRKRREAGAEHERPDTQPESEQVGFAW
jgi:hypothetical protein